MKLQTIQSLLEMGKPAQVCDQCGHSPIHKTHNYYKGAWKCKNAPLPGYPKSSASAGTPPVASPAASPTPAATPAPTRPQPTASSPAAAPAPAPTAAPTVARPVAPVSTPTAPKAVSQPAKSTSTGTSAQKAGSFLSGLGIEQFTINADGTVDVHEDCNFTDIGTKKVIPVKLGKVEGEFHLAGLIESLRNCPKEVTEDCDITHTEIKNLEGFPEAVGDDVNLEDNKELVSLEGLTGLVVGGNFTIKGSPKLTSLENIHKKIAAVNGNITFVDCNITNNVVGLLRIKGVKKIILPNTKMAEILNKYIQDSSLSIYDAVEELADAGFEDAANF